MEPEQLASLMDAARRGSASSAGPITSQSSRTTMVVAANEQRGIMGGYDGSMGHDSRDSAKKITKIRSVKELRIDRSSVLESEAGDLAVVQTEMFRCQPIDPLISEYKLFLTRMQCVDRRTFDLKFYEVEQQSRYAGHPNIIAIYSFWTEEPESSYVYKTLVTLMEEPLGRTMEANYGLMTRSMGDVLPKADSSVPLSLSALGSMSQVLSAPPVPRPEPRSNFVNEKTLLSQTADIIRALFSLHGVGIVHGKIRPSNIYINAEGSALLGPFGRAEADAYRQTTQLMSKILIGRALPSTLAYWAPELLTGKRYGPEADMWALGVTLFHVASGCFPFQVDNEDAFRASVLQGTYDLEQLSGFPHIARLVRNLIRVTPRHRWTVQHAQLFIQTTFAVTIQRSWRAYRLRSQFVILRMAARCIQRTWLGYKVRRERGMNFANRQENSAARIQASFRGRIAREKASVRIQAIAIMQSWAQSVVYARRFHELRNSSLLIQCVGRMHIARKNWVQVRVMRNKLAGNLQDLRARVSSYNTRAGELCNLFTPLWVHEVPPSVAHMRTFEDWEISQAQTSLERGYTTEQITQETVLPVLCGELIAGIAESQRVAEERARLEELEIRVASYEEKELRLKERLGTYYSGYDDAVEKIVGRLERLNQLSQTSNCLEVRLAHDYEYSRWEQNHERENVADNVLIDDESVFRRVNPCIDLAFTGGKQCFVAGIVVDPGQAGPATLEISLARAPGAFYLVGTFDVAESGRQVFRVTGDTINVAEVRLQFKGNHRGGSISAIRLVEVLGVQGYIGYDD